jgi:predicted transcriptional regulator
MARDDLHFRLRIPDGLKARIEEAARANKRSMTGEIIARLESSFSVEGAPDLNRRMSELEERVRKTEEALQRR